ncbi:MAG: AAA family ATPase [Microthrixaceae bacterium]|nr:AAA family ATPase [Microthrixaceae bacterium]
MEQLTNVSVLFTDLVGSTAMSTSVSPKVADELRREHFSVLRQAIAKADGTEVKNLGDGLMVVFSTASAALACAVEMQQATELDNREREVRFGLRVGLSSGEAVDEDGDYFGDPIVEAARLCARCEAGQILATDIARLMAGRRNPHMCEPLGDLELKGLPDPVASVEVHWTPLADTDDADRVPLPTRLKSRPATGLVGRSVEAASLHQAWKRVAAGDGRELVIVAGEAGLGKTTLLANAARAAFEDGACVLFGHAEEDLATPYGLFAEALGHLVTHAQEATLRTYVDSCGSDLARIVPALTRRLPDLDPPQSSDAETERYRLLASVVGLVNQITAVQPVVMVLDDLQCADSASLQMLRHLTSEDIGLRLLILASFRDNEIASGHQLVDTLAALWRTEGVTRVDLRGLDDSGVIELVEATAGHELDDSGVNLAHALSRETDGNPFFVAEVLRHLVETGALFQDDTGRWVSDLTVAEVRLPDSVREVIGARVSRLGPEATRVLSTAAVIGRDFDLELLALATSTSEDTVLDLLEAAELAALVRDPISITGKFTFSHALIQHTLYQDLSHNRRARIHERVAEALEDLTVGRPGERVSELAYHWAQATRPADTAKAVGYSAQAGAAALAALAPADAVRWFTQALELLAPTGDLRQRAEILIGLGNAQRETGTASHRETLLEAAQLADQIDDVPLLVQAVLANNRGYHSVVGGVDEDRIAAIDRALERLSHEPSPERARLLGLSSAERTYAVGLPERLALAEDAVAGARQSGDRSALLWAMQLAFRPINHPSTLDLYNKWTQEALGLVADSDDVLLRYHIHVNTMLAALQRADLSTLESNAAVAQQIATQVPHTSLRWNAKFHQAWQHGLKGDLAGFELGAEHALNYGIENGEPDAFTIFAAQITHVRFYQGRLHELVPVVEQALADSPTLYVFKAVLTLAKARGGELDAARQMLEDDLRLGFPMPEDQAWSTGLSAWADAASVLGDSRAAAALKEMILPYHDQIPSAAVGFFPSAAHYLGCLDHILGNYNSAERWFEEALRLHSGMQSPILVATTQAAFAKMLVAIDSERSRALASSAHKTAMAGGFGYIEADAASVLQQLG